MGETQPVYKGSTQETQNSSSQEGEINPSSRGYLYWHTLNQFKSRIKDVMDEIKLHSKDESSTFEANIFEILLPISIDLTGFVEHLISLADEQEEDEIEDE